MYGTRRVLFMEISIYNKEVDYTCRLAGMYISGGVYRNDTLGTVTRNKNYFGIH